MITSGGNPITIIGKMTEVGQKAVDFTAVNLDLSPFKFSELPKDKIKVISAAPSLDTGTCSLQTIFFNEEAGKLKDDVELITITMDLPFAQKRFCATKGIENLTVVSDYQIHDFANKYGFLIEGIRLLTRGVIVIDKDDTVKYVEYVQETHNEPNYEKALEAIRALI